MKLFHEYTTMIIYLNQAIAYKLSSPWYMIGVQFIRQTRTITGNQVYRRLVWNKSSNFFKEIRSTTAHQSYVKITNNDTCKDAVLVCYGNPSKKPQKTPNVKTLYCQSAKCKLTVRIHGVHDRQHLVRFCFRKSLPIVLHHVCKLLCLWVVGFCRQRSWYISVVGRVNALVVCAIKVHVVSGTRDLLSTLTEMYASSSSSILLARSVNASSISY